MRSEDISSLTEHRNIRLNFLKQQFDGQHVHNVLIDSEAAGAGSVVGVVDPDIRNR